MITCWNDNILDLLGLISYIKINFTCFFCSVEMTLKIAYLVCNCALHYISVGECSYKILLTSKIYLFVDEEKTPEQIMQEKQIEA